MAKHSSKEHAVPMEDPLHWQAESLVTDALRNTPQYRAAVKQTLRGLKAVRRSAKQVIVNRKNRSQKP